MVGVGLLRPVGLDVKAIRYIDGREPGFADIIIFR